MNRKFKKIAPYIFSLFILILLFFFVFPLLPIHGNYKLLKVLSGSMEPIIRTGSVIMVKPVDEYEIGDIITFDLSSSGAEPITHRIHDIKTRDEIVFYVTKGDANNAPDMREIEKENIMGKTILAIPFIGYAVDFIQKPIGLTILIVSLALGVMVGEINKIWKEKIKLHEK